MEHLSLPKALLDLAEVDLDRIADALAGISQYQRVSKKDIVRTQLAAIEVARNRGIGFTAIAQALTEQGCPISPRVLRKYVSALRADAQSGRGRATTSTASVAKADLEQLPFEVLPAAEPKSATTTAEPVRRSLRRSALLENQRNKS